MGLIIGKRKRLELESAERAAEPGGTTLGKADRSGEGEGTVRISFRMAGDLHRRLKLEAVRQGQTIVAMLEGFVAEHTPVA